MTKITQALTVIVLLFATVCSADDAIDVSDPTRIYTFAGGGLKYTDFTNGSSLLELRATGNVGLSEKDMVTFELGYGELDSSSEQEQKDDTDFTNSRLRWFHLADMDYAVPKGYRGWALQTDLQLAGSLAGTDGQNVVAVGGIAAYAINPKWSFYLALNGVNTWDKKFEKYNGFGVGVAPLIVYTPDWWSGAYVQLWPNYTRFVSNELSGEGSGNIDLNIGGQLSDNLFWAGTYQQNIDKDLRSFRRGEDTGLTNDWNVFLSLTTYF